ncbi:MAG: hypothetical protein ACLTDM_20985 [Clostridium butyricum]
MSKQLCFKVDGEWLTDFIRNSYYQKDESYEECKSKLLRSLCLSGLKEDEKEQLAQDIIFGNKKFIGVNNLELVDDTDFDVYKYSRFSRPNFNESEKGIRGILTREGMFVQCEHQQHNSAIEAIGHEKCKGSLAFWMGLIGAGVSKDNHNDKISIQQKKWFEKNKEYMHKEQIKSWNRLVEIEILQEKYKEDYDNYLNSGNY